MIPDFKTFIKESIWSDLQDRSSGDVVRKEDDDSNKDIFDVEVYLKKIYYLLNGTEVPPKPGETDVTLGNALYQFPCLNRLKYYPQEKYRKLNEYLELIKHYRNTSAGNGAHFSMFMSEKELDNSIKAIVTIYMFVTGMCLDQLRDKYEVLEPVVE